MNQTTRSSLLSAAVLIGSACHLGATVAPYASADANTLHLYHLDSPASPGSDANVVAGGGTVHAVDINGSSANEATLTTVLGAASFGNFGTCANFGTNADYGLGFDGNADGNYDGEASSASVDAIPLSNLQIDGANPFTLEAVINTGNQTSGKRQVICTDRSSTPRAFQFCLNAGGSAGQQLEFNLPADNARSAPIPNSGVNAFAADTWYHVAVTYDGATLKFYWTKISGGTTTANQIGSDIAVAGFTDAGAASGLLVLGNENRGSAGEGLRGRIDEVRISKVARAANEFIFSFVDSDSDTLDDGYEEIYFGNNNGVVEAGELDQTAAGDFDGDFLSNGDEAIEETDPTNQDTDGDGLQDGPEANDHGTEPLVADTDGDGLSDGAEAGIGGTGTDPLAADTDFDSFSDYVEEVLYGTDGNEFNSMPDQFAIMDNTKYNGSFELVNGAQATANVTTGFDTVGNDVDNWKQWISTAGGTTASTSAIHGDYVGTFPSGGTRGAYNMTSYVAKENDVISLEWYCPTNNTNVTGFIVYDDDDNQATAPIQGLAVASQDSGVTGPANRNRPAGSPMIGKKIGVAFDGSGGANIDSIHLTLKDVDSDGDDLSDFAEDQYWGNNDGNPLPDELTVTTGAADPDGDGFSNAAEVEADSSPLNALSRPGDEDGDSLQDEWEVTYFGNITAQDGSGDPDADYATNEQEETADTNPLDTSAWPDTDDDTLNDGWEVVYFGSTAAQDASDDPDGDGADNAAEYAAGSAPNDGLWSPSQAKLAHRWNFNGNLDDSVGGSHATIVEVGGNDVTQTADGVTLTGGAQEVSDHVSLGSNLVGGQKNPVTIELWATQDQVQDWSRIFSFGSSTTEALMMSWTQGTNVNQDQVQFRDGVTISSPNTNAPYIPGVKYHIVMTLTPAIHSGGAIGAGTRVTWYRAAVAGSGSSNVTPLWAQRGTFDTTNTLVALNDVHMWLGRSEFGDNTASATYDEVRIWDGALTQSERTVAQAAGPNAANLAADTDADGLPDAWEVGYFGDTAQGNVDSDGDGALNAVELAEQSNPNNAASKPGDVDADGLSDPNFEILYFGDLDESGTGDPDGDFANNELEETGDSLHEGGPSNPTSAADYPDTDEDTLNDGLEEHYFGNDDGDIDAGELAQGASGDFDGDTISNGDEIFGTLNVNFGSGRTNPADPDSDDDGRTDAQELSPGVTDPNDADTDNDGLPDGEEATAGSDPLLTDTDSDTYSDYREVLLGSDPNKSASTPVIPALYGFISNTKRNGSFELVNGVVATADVENGWDLPGNDVDNWMLRFGTSTEGGVDSNAAAADGTHVGIFTGGVVRGIYNLSDHVAQAGEIFFLQWFHVADDSGNTGYIVYDHDDNPATVPVVVNDPAATMESAGVSTTTPNVIVWRVPAGSPVIGHKIGAGLEGTGSTRVDSVTFGVQAIDSDSDGMTDYDEEFWFGDADETIEAGELAQTGTGDFDGDGTDNATELRLNLDPKSSSARFAATFTAPATITWPSVTGVTFKVERSTTLLSWETLAPSLPGTSGTGSFTDAEPPVDKVFYRVTLNP